VSEKTVSRAREAEQRGHWMLFQYACFGGETAEKAIELHDRDELLRNALRRNPPSHTECGTNARESGSAHEIASMRDRVIECLKRSAS
jgi:hypothetical protein